MLRRSPEQTNNESLYRVLFVLFCSHSTTLSTMNTLFVSSDMGMHVYWYYTWLHGGYVCLLSRLQVGWSMKVNLSRGHVVNTKQSYLKSFRLFHFVRWRNASLWRCYSKCRWMTVSTVLLQLKINSSRWGSVRRTPKVRCLVCKSGNGRGISPPLVC